VVNPLLSVEALTVERGGRIVLSALSFALHPGEIILVSGRNGAGKSTLLRTLSGLLAPASGTIRWGLADDDVRGVETAHYLGYEDALKPSLTVGENLDFWARMLAADRQRIAEVVQPKDALAAFGIARLADLPAAYLSAGQKRRVALARLLLNPRPVWLLDEPLIALDVATQGTLTAIMARHVAQGGAILVASHQPLALAYREIDLTSMAA
jgi:heme exporter protein A